jgi:hypothetical protein
MANELTDLSTLLAGIADPGNAPHERIKGGACRRRGPACSRRCRSGRLRAERPGIALDLLAGRQEWMFDPKLPADLQPASDFVCRGVAATQMIHPRRIEPDDFHNADL